MSFPNLSYRAINRAYHAKPLEGFYRMTRDDSRRERLLMKAFDNRGKPRVVRTPREVEDELRDAS